MEFSQILEIEYILTYKGDISSQVGPEVYTLTPFHESKCPIFFFWLSMYHLLILFKTETLGSHTLGIQI